MDEVGGDFHAGTAAADDDHLFAAELARIAVIRRVEHATRKAVMPCPARQLGNPPMPGGNDDVPGRPLPSRRGQPPAIRDPVDSVHLDAEVHLQVMLGGVRLYIADELVSRRKDRRLSRKASEPQHYVPPARVHPQPVIPRPPGGGDALAALDDLGRHAQLAKPGCGGQSCGSGSDDHYRLGGSG
jgi:hypothetical protein